MTFLCLLLPEAGPIMHQLTCTSQLVHHLLVCMMIIAKLKAVRKVPAFPPGNLEIHAKDIKFMKPYKDVCTPCEQNRDQLRSALSEGDKDLLMEDWFAHTTPSKCVHLFYNL